MRIKEVQGQPGLYLRIPAVLLYSAVFVFFQKNTATTRRFSLNPPLVQNGRRCLLGEIHACGTRPQFRADAELGPTGIGGICRVPFAGVAFSLPYVDAAAYLPTKPALSSPLKDPS